MYKKISASILAISFVLLSSCASVPMESEKLDLERKQFNAPTNNKAGLYIFRDSFVGQALEKIIKIDGKQIGVSINNVYFYNEITPGEHTIATESEFSDNAITVNAVAGKNLFVEQFIKMGVFVGGADLELVSEEEGKEGVLECKLAQQVLEGAPSTK